MAKRIPIIKEPSYIRLAEAMIMKTGKAGQDKKKKGKKKLKKKSLPPPPRKPKRAVRIPLAKDEKKTKKIKQKGKKKLKKEKGKKRLKKMYAETIWETETEDFGRVIIKEGKDGCFSMRTADNSYYFGRSYDVEYISFYFREIKAGYELVIMGPRSKEKVIEIIIPKPEIGKWRFKLSKKRYRPERFYIGVFKRILELIETGEIRIGKKWFRFSRLTFHLIKGKLKPVGVEIDPEEVNVKNN